MTKIVVDNKYRGWRRMCDRNGGLPRHQPLSLPHFLIVNHHLYYTFLLHSLYLLMATSHALLLVAYCPIMSPTQSYCPSSFLPISHPLQTSFVLTYFLFHPLHSNRHCPLKEEDLIEIVVDNEGFLKMGCRGLRNNLSISTRMCSTL